MTLWNFNCNVHDDSLTCKPLIGSFHTTPTKNSSFFAIVYLGVTAIILERHSHFINVVNDHPNNNL